MKNLIPLTCLVAGIAIGGVFMTPALAQHTDMASSKSKMASPSAMMHMSMSAMGKNMAKMKMTGDVDRDFATMMAEHHLGAIKMAEIEVRHGKNARLKTMAKMMIAMQKKERTELLKHAKMNH